MAPLDPYTASFFVASQRSLKISVIVHLAANFFAGARSEILYVLPAKLIGEVHFVVSRGIDLVVRAPGIAVRILVARRIVVFDKGSGLRARILEGVTGVPMPGPGVNGIVSERAGLLVHFDVVIEILE